MALSKISILLIKIAATTGQPFNIGPYGKIIYNFLRNQKLE